MTSKPVLIKESILVDQNFNDLNESIDVAGKLLLDNGYIEQEYIESMKEKSLKTPVYNLSSRSRSCNTSWNVRWV